MHSRMWVEGPEFNYKPYSGEKGTDYIRNLCIASPHGAIGLFMCAWLYIDCNLLGTATLIVNFLPHVRFNLPVSLSYPLFFFIFFIFYFEGEILSNPGFV